MGERCEEEMREEERWGEKCRRYVWGRGGVGEMCGGGEVWERCVGEGRCGRDVWRKGEMWRGRREKGMEGGEEGRMDRGMEGKEVGKIKHAYNR